MPLETHIQKAADSAPAGLVAIKLAGSLDTATAPQLEKELAPVLTAPVKDIVLDRAELKFISSAGLRVFSMVRKQLKERAARRPSPACSRGFRKLSRSSSRCPACLCSWTWRSLTPTWRSGSVPTRRTKGRLELTSRRSRKDVRDVLWHAKPRRHCADK